MTLTALSEHSYTLTYQQPRLISHNPIQFENDHATHRFTAADSREAQTKARTFLREGVVSYGKVSAYRKGKQLVQNHPYNVVHEYVPANKVKAAMQR